MAKEITLIHKETGQIKTINIGWSWLLFLSPLLLSIPLFKIKLHSLGIILLMFLFMNIFFAYLTTLPYKNPMVFIVLYMILIITFGLTIFVGAKGNEMVLNNYLYNGWVVKDK